MRTREATLEDLARVPGKAELVNGRIVRMSPTGGLPGYAGREIVASLHAYSRRTGVGHAIPDNVAFTVTLPHRRSFSPDAAFYVGELRMGFLEGAPRFAVEVRSESDYGPAAERRFARRLLRGRHARRVGRRPPRRGRGACVSRAGAPDGLPAG